MDKPRLLSLALRSIGEVTSDYAISVFFDDRDESFWFARHWLNWWTMRPAAKSRSMVPRRSGFARRLVNGAKNPSKRKPRNRGGAFGTHAEQIVCTRAGSVFRIKFGAANGERIAPPGQLTLWRLMQIAKVNPLGAMVV